jgi:hypothetical protein
MLSNIGNYALAQCLSYKFPPLPQHGKYVYNEGMRVRGLTKSGLIVVSRHLFTSLSIAKYVIF